MASHLSLAPVVTSVFTALLLGASGSMPAEAQAPSGPELLESTLKRHCLTCHSDRVRTADLSLEALDVSQAGEHAEVWEKVISKLRTRSMPPAGRPRPSDDTYELLAGWLETEVDRFAAAHPNPGRTEAFHRLNRAEYANAIRDLLALDVDVAALLPADNIDEHGFDNIADVLTVSPSLMDRYLSAARKIGRLVVGEAPHGPVTETYKVPILLKQGDRMGDGLPFGSRGGIGIRHYFPVDGDYELSIRLHRNYVNYVRGLGSRHELEVRLDGALVQSFIFGGEEPEGVQAPASYAGNQFGDPAWEEYMLYADADMRVRFEAQAGPRVVGVSFVRRFTEPEGVLQPRQTAFAAAADEERDGDAAVEQVAISGPFASAGPGDTPSRKAVFVCTPASRAAEDETACARRILSSLARRAYRRPLDAADLDTLMGFFQSGRQDASFDAGIQLALERLLISPDFLFRIERDPADVEPGSPYAITDLELASRLSFFLWSSIPDARLLELAERRELQDPAVLEAETRRLLSDPRAASLVRNFAGQWLYLRNLAGIVPDAETFPEFDENLPKRIQIRDRAVRPRALFAKTAACSISWVPTTPSPTNGWRFTMASRTSTGATSAAWSSTPSSPNAAAESFGHGSLLTATSYPNRTSPVLRGKWVLTNILGTPPPPPPADVPDLPDRGEDGRPATVRERLQRHRESPVCSACHAPMDPLGLALENYDAIGKLANRGPSRAANRRIRPASRWDRLSRADRPSHVIARASGPACWHGRRETPLVRPGKRARISRFNRPSGRLPRTAASDDYRWSSIIVGIVKSTPFRMRRSAS